MLNRFYNRLLKLSVGSLLRKLVETFLQFKYRSHAVPKKYDWDWESKGFNRVALVNQLVFESGGWDSSYLEIGCAKNDLFFAIGAKHKIGVDPLEGGTHRMTSDQFFAESTAKFDVVFIDGLHEYKQARSDAINAIESVALGGWIAFHDFLPSSWKEQHVPRLQSTWTGDCWKLAIELTKAKGLDFKIVEIDFGVGLLRKRSHDWVVPDMRDILEDADFEVFANNLESLPLIGFETAVEFINNKNLS